MATSVSDLIHSSFRLIGAIAAGETLETNELADALVSLNQMIASWNTEGLTIAGRARLSVAVNPSSNQYQLPVRMVSIVAASTAIQGVDNPLEIVDAAGWEAISEKGELAIFTRKLFCDYVYPISTVWIWPTPRFAGTLEMFYFPPIAALGPDLNTLVDLPPGYEAALRYNFAIALLPEYPRSAPDPSLPAQAQNYKASLVQLNAANHMRSQTSSPAQSAVSDAAQTAAR